MSDNRPLSLLTFLIYQLSVTIHAINRPRTQCALFYKIHFTAKQFFQFHIHSGNLHQSYTLTAVINHQYIHITVCTFFATCKRPEQSCAFHQLRREISCNGGYNVCAHFMSDYKWIYTAKIAHLFVSAKDLMNKKFRLA